MMQLQDHASMAHALTLDLDPELHHLLSERIATLESELVDATEYLVIQPGDTEADIVRAIGFSPLVEPIDGARFGEPEFHPHWDWLVAHGGWYEMIVTFGSSFAVVLLIEDAKGVPADLRAMCKNYELIA